MNIYISGKITGDKDYYEKFMKAQELLEKLEFDVINPALVSSMLPELTHEQYLDICMALVRAADAIYMLPDYKESKGATKELQYALELEKDIMFCKTKNSE